MLLQNLIVFACLAQKQMRIACIGNSITYGYLVHDREHNSYPAQLQAMLGEGYTVMNFGSSGKTALHQGGNPYIETQQYRNALNSQANIVFIKLGTNDSRPYYRKYIDSFYVNYKELVHTFKQLPTHPRVILLAPVVNFLNPVPGDPFNKDIPNFIIPVVKQVAAEEQCEFIDLHPLLIDHPEMYSDKLHPDSAGAHIIAKKLYEVLVPVKKTGKIRIPTAIKALEKDKEGFNLYELIAYAGTAFRDEKTQCFLYGNVPNYWKRSHNFYSFFKERQVRNTF